MLLHLYLIFSVDKWQYSRPLHMQAHVPDIHAQWPCLSSLASCKCTGEAEGETRTQGEAVGTCKRKHVSPPVPNVSSHYIQQQAHWAN